MSFHVGQKVECVDDSPPRNKNPRLATKHRLVLGKIYIIRGFDDESAPPGILLEGLVDPIVPPWEQELGWSHKRFRPITERKTDISTFTRMLTPNSKEKVSA